MEKKIFDSSRSHTPDVIGEHAECSDGNQISHFPDKWASLKVCYSDIEEATNGLSETSMIGKGGYGSVYKGKLGRNAVAIKILDSTSKQGQKEFFQELKVLYELRHPNLVKLVGVCLEVRAVIYEYLPHGSLEDFLKENPSLLTWKMRTRIIYEICLALIYLHSRSVVHGDLKPANILLDANFKSKLSDFGLCRFLPEDMTSSVYLETVPKGTSGYIDPWFLETWILRPGSDLYSFGITILKLLTGLPPIGLGIKARDTDENSFREMIDPTAGSWPFEMAKELLYWSLQCCYHNDQKSMGLLKDMSTCLEDMLADIETVQGGGFKVVPRTVEVEDTNEEPAAEVIMVVKIYMHNATYAQEIKERILRMKGVEGAEAELESSLVSMIGIFDPSKLVEYVYRTTGKRALIVKVLPVAEYDKAAIERNKENIISSNSHGRLPGLPTCETIPCNDIEPDCVTMSDVDEVTSIAGYELAECLSCISGLMCCISGLMCGFPEMMRCSEHDVLPIAQTNASDAVEGCWDVLESAGTYSSDAVELEEDEAEMDMCADYDSDDAVELESKADVLIARIREQHLLQRIQSTHSDGDHEQ